MEQLNILALENQTKKKYINKLHEYLEELFDKYNNKAFITNDPIRVPHRYSDPKDQEIMCLIASMMAQGRRTKIVESLDKIEGFMEKNPYEFIKNFNYETQAERFKDFNHFAYRNIPGSDIVCIIYLLKQVLNDYGSLKKLFLKGLDTNNHKNVKEALINFTETIFAYSPPHDLEGLPPKLTAMLPNPKKRSACKRLNMFLRWVVRKDEVDFGLWHEVPTSMLLIPLDVHVSKLSRKLGLVERKQDDWITAELITESLKQFDPIDPTRYDFAIFGAGISGEKVFAPE